MLPILVYTDAYHNTGLAAPFSLTRFTGVQISLPESVRQFGIAVSTCRYVNNRFRISNFICKIRFYLLIWYGLNGPFLLMSYPLLTPPFSGKMCWSIFCIVLSAMLPFMAGNQFPNCYDQLWRPSIPLILPPKMYIDRRLNAPKQPGWRMEGWYAVVK